MPDIFLSYSRDDQAVARRFAEGLQHAGFSVWWDQALNAGQAFDRVTEKALEDARAVVVLWSKHSVESNWVRAEATQAHASQKLVPVMIEACKRPIMFELTHTAELAHWHGNADDPAWQGLVNSLRQFAPADASATATTINALPQPPRKLKPLGLMLAGLAALGLIAGGLVWKLSGSTGSGAAATQQQLVTLAVLPFVNLSSDPEQEYFSDGLTEELLNQLAQVSGLQVTARTSSFAFKGKNEDMRVIGEKLGVEHLLEGSVRKSGDELRITAQLINARNGAHLWSETFDRKLADIFAVQDEIAKNVAGKLTVALDVGEMSRARGGTTSIEAYDKYLQARAIGWRRGSAQELLQSAQLYREAVQIDPDFIRAWVNLYDDLEGIIAFLPAYSAAGRAEREQIVATLEKRAPDDWRVRNLRALRLVDQNKWSEAAAEFEATRAAATAAGENDGNIGNVFILKTGRMSQVVPRQIRRRDQDPLSLSMSVFLQIGLNFTGRFDEAEAEYQRSLSLEGNHLNVENLRLSRLILQSADIAAIDTQLKRIRPLQPARDLTLLTAVLHDPKSATDDIRRFMQDPAWQNASDIEYLANLADYLGEQALALQALRRSYVDMRQVTVGNLWQVWKSGLRATPEFKSILKDLGLADYFRESGNWPDACKPISDTDYECQ